MIVTHTEKFRTLRGGYLRTKRELIAPLLAFVSACRADGGCVLCLNEAKADDGTEDSIERKLCSFCIAKVHTRHPLLCLRLQAPAEYAELQQFVERMCGISGSSYPELERCGEKVLQRCGEKAVGRHGEKVLQRCGEKVWTIDEVQRVYDDLRELGECNTGIPEGQLIMNMRQKIKRDKLKLAVRNQIRFKIKIFDEQLENLKDSYVTALGSGNFEDSAEMKSVFFRIFESKIDLEERLGRY